MGVGEREGTKWGTKLKYVGKIGFLLLMWIGRGVILIDV